MDTNQAYQLPEPQGIMTAKTYKTKFAQPVIDALKTFARKILIRYFKAVDSYMRVNQNNSRLYDENQRLIQRNDRLKEENSVLREGAKDYALLRKVFGSRQIDELLEKAKSIQSEQHEHQRHSRNFDYGR